MLNTQLTSQTQTLSFSGQQWGAVNRWNPLGDNDDNSMALASSGSRSRTVMFRHCICINFLDRSMTPFLLDGDYRVEC